ncbi:hypothetical protein DFQ27_001320 [Actinomortierella ambigua]|uniref:EXPERA domain-containing protein n=1 Tax=Actinomortierella ambigua TaxID=1343610 RepID=A0A9P6QE41_9FUNG|nr:hypothetical protein DFQ27_001320 [Actinomortierella ambigua]
MDPVVMEQFAGESHTPHPFYPRGLVLDHYVPNTDSMEKTVGIVFAAFGAIILGALAVGYQRRSSTIRGIGSQLTFVWLVTCGFTHLILEGYYVVFHKTLAGQNSPLAQIWKEYSLADSRYLTSDPTVLGIEAITAFAWGPLAFYTAFAQYYDLPSRHILQLIVSLGQLYGSVIYYFTTLFEGSPHGDPDPYYFYFYFIHFNAWWVFVPILLMYSSIKHLYRPNNTSAKGKKEKKKHH